jgi:hypothetical protein
MTTIHLKTGATNPRNIVCRNILQEIGSVCHNDGVKDQPLSQTIEITYRNFTRNFIA